MPEKAEALQKEVVASVSVQPKPAEAQKPRTGAKAPTKTFSIPKFSDVKGKINQPQVEETKEEEIPTKPAAARRSKPFTEEDVKMAWTANLQKLEAAGRSQDATILKEELDIQGDEISLAIANEALEPAFEKIKSEVLMSLRDSLENDNIVLRSKMVQVDKSKMLYTDQEKFEHLKRKYPALKDLQDKLGLDPEF